MKKTKEKKSLKSKKAENTVRSKVYKKEETHKDNKEHNQKNNKNKTFLILSVVVIAFILSLSLVILTRNLNRSLWWDEAIYLMLSKSIVSKGNFGYFEDFRPVGWSFVLLPFYNVNNPIIMFSVLSLIITILNLFLTYKIFDKIIGKLSALISLPLIFMYSSIYTNSIIGLSEHIAIFFALISLILYFKNHKITAVIFSAFSFLSRFPFGLVFGSIIITEIISILTNFFKIRNQEKNKKKKTNFNKKSYVKLNQINLKKQILSILLLILVFIIVISPYLIFMQVTRGSFLHPFIRSVKVVNISGELDALPKGFYFKNLFFQVPILFLLPLSILLLKEKKKEVFTILLISFLMLFYFSFSVDHKEMRYINLVVFLLIPLSVPSIKKLKAKKISKHFKRDIISLVILLYLISLILEISFSSYVFISGYDQDYIVKEFANMIPKNETEIISSDVALGAFLNVKIHPFSSYLYVMQTINQSNASYLFTNTCSLMCPAEMDDSCKEEENKFKKFVSDKTIIKQETKKISNRECVLTLYKIR